VAAASRPETPHGTEHEGEGRGREGDKESKFKIELPAERVAPTPPPYEDHEARRHRAREPNTRYYYVTDNYGDEWRVTQEQHFESGDWVETSRMKTGRNGHF